MWARGFTCFLLLQLGAGALSASHSKSSKAHLQARSAETIQRRLRQVDNEPVDASAALGLIQSAAERTNKHPKKADKKEELEHAAPAKAKIQKAAAAVTATPKKDTEVYAELEETLAEAHDTIADAEGTAAETDAADASEDSEGVTKSTESVEKTEDTTAESPPASEEAEETEETKETEESEDSEDDKETEADEAGETKEAEEDGEEADEAGKTKEAEAGGDAEEVEEVEEADEEAKEVEEADGKDAEELVETDKADDGKDESDAAETVGAADEESVSETEEKSGETSKTEIELETEDAVKSKKAAKTEEASDDKDTKTDTKAAKESTKKGRKTRESKEVTAKAQTEVSENVKAQQTETNSEELHTEEHADLPKLKAWAMMGRLFRRLRASAVAFQGGSPDEVALIAQSPEDNEPSTGSVFSTLLIWSVLSGLVAYFYSNHKEKPSSVDAEKQEGVEVFQEWKHGLFSCHEEPEVTLCACFCPGIRWATTLSYVPGMLSFWVAFLIYVCVELLGGLTAGTIGWICLALLCTAYRQELRQKFNMEQQGGMTYVTDAMTYLCCTCCAIAQEARHVEDALKSGHPALQESEEKSEAGQ